MSALSGSHPGDDPAAVQQSLRKALPDTIAVFTKPQLIEFERKFQADVRRPDRSLRWARLSALWLEC